MVPINKIIDFSRLRMTISAIPKIPTIPTKTKGYFAFLLKTCPYSQKMARRLSLNEKVWVQRCSPIYWELKEKYMPTFPMVFHDNKLIGGYEDYEGYEGYEGKTSKTPLKISKVSKNQKINKK